MNFDKQVCKQSQDQPADIKSEELININVNEILAHID